MSGFKINGPFGFGDWQIPNNGKLQKLKLKEKNKQTKNNIFTYMNSPAVGEEIVNFVLMLPNLYGVNVTGTFEVWFAVIVNSFSTVNEFSSSICNK